ncbi:uncharacterized protein LOC112199391 [Rosa chinensis]|uniref:uncharacterized protein LOC112199391 n=1 Tax=Rosa chinensis TaxID=74649 RepID=UPI000D088ABC|nr:uncharacterized protein LOC112199391 [Rosa chinensis]
MAAMGDGSAAALINHDSARVSLGFAGLEALRAYRWYMVGQLLGPEAMFPSFKGTISTIWRIRSGLIIQDVGECFVFQFDRVADRNKILHGGMWFYRNTMLVFGAYDGVGLAAEVPLNSLETLVVIKGLPLVLRNKTALGLIGSAIGRVIRFDQTILNKKEEEQRIRIVFDVQHQVRVWKVFEFSPVVVPELTMVYEKIKGFCLSCGLFIHDAAGYDAGEGEGGNSRASTDDSFGMSHFNFSTA